MSKRTSNPKDLRFVIVRQHMAILTLKQRVAKKDKQIQKLELQIMKLRQETWLRKLARRIMRFFKGKKDA